MLHKVRDLLVRQCTMLINALRANLAEFGIIAAQGAVGVTAIISALDDMLDSLPEAARKALHGLTDKHRMIKGKIDKMEVEIVDWHRGTTPVNVW